MLATTTIDHPTSVTAPVTTRSGRCPRPRTLKRKLQNREAQRKYRETVEMLRFFVSDMLNQSLGEKQARILEDLKRQVAVVQSEGSNVGIHTAPQASSTKDRNAVSPYLGRFKEPSQHQSSNSSSEPFNLTDCGNLDIEFSRSFISEITSVFDEKVFNLRDEDPTPAASFFRQKIATMEQATQNNIIDMSDEVLLDTNDANLDSCKVSGHVNQIQPWSSAIDTDLNGKLLTLIDPDSDFDDHIRATYPHECGTIDKRKDVSTSISTNKQPLALAVNEIKILMTTWFHTHHSRGSPYPHPANHYQHSFPFDPYRNNLRLIRTATLDAYISNAVSLGHDNPTLYRLGGQSPFYRPRPLSLSQLRASTTTSERYLSLPPDLRPTPPQVLCPHHPFFDLLPFPVLRARAIALSVRSPTLFDIADFKSDIMREGLVCWTTIGGGSCGGGAKGGQPWEMRSWEAKGWFLRKWSFLVGGEEEDVWRGTRWWRGVRGDGDG